MKSNNYDFAVIGGDLRQEYIVSFLIDYGFSVIVYGLNIEPSLEGYSIGNSLADVMKSASVLITPIPFTIDKIHIKSQNNPDDLTIENFINNLDCNHLVYGGSFGNELISYFEQTCICYYDFMKKEEIILYNSIATAEGAIAEAIKLSKINLHDSSCLVLGFGRCGKTLAIKLSGLCQNVSVALRSSVANMEASINGFNVVEFKDLKKHVGEYDFIFNTVPTLILPEDVLDKTKQDVTIIDIASSPGGVDYKYAKKKGINANLCLGLPGKYAPKSSAEYLVSCMLEDLREW
jgi:dipicolinate synthase subunit A